MAHSSLVSIWSAIAFAAVAVLAVGCEEGESDNARVENAITAYNTYVRELSAPIATTAAECLSAGAFGDLAAVACREWVEWTESRSLYLDQAIDAFDVAFDDEDADSWRSLQLANLRGYWLAFSQMADAIAKNDGLAWNSAVAAFYAAQQTGKEADRLRLSFLGQ